MPATAAGIKAVTGSTEDDPVFAPFIIAADCVMAELAARGCTTGISTACLDQAANFLGAHFFVTSKPGEKSATKVSERFENYAVTLKVGANNGTGLISTSYGETANAMLGGCLATLDKPRAVNQFA